MVSSADFPRHWSHDRLYSPDCQPETDARGRSRAVRHLRCLHGGTRPRLHARPGRCNSHYRRCRRPHRHLPFVEARPQPDGSHSRVSLLLHGPRAGDTAANNASAHNQKRAPHQDEAGACRGSERKDSLPHHRDASDMLRGALWPSTARNALLRKPSA